MANDTSDRIRRIFSDSLSVQVPSDEADLIDGGLLDSLALVELLFQIEREFGIEVSFDELDIENFRTVERITQFVERAGQANAA